MRLNPSSLPHLEQLLARYPLLADVQDPIVGAVEMICVCHRAGGKVLVCGNGGSASDSEHIVAELMKGFVLRRAVPSADAEQLRHSGIADWGNIASSLQQGVPAIALTTNTALLTAIANDTDPAMLFAQQVYVYGRQGDVLLGLSTSGNSRNVLNALKVARAFGLSTVGLSGGSAAQMDELCDVIVKVPEAETFKAQEYHLPIYHAMCLMIEEELFGA